jgi:serine protease AprX
LKVIETTKTVVRYALPRNVQMAAGLESLVTQSQALAERAASLAKELQVTVTTESVAGEPLQAQRGKLSLDNLNQFRPKPDRQQSAAEKLSSLGFTVVRIGRFGITVRGSAELVARVVKQPLVLQALGRRSPLRATRELAGSFAAPTPAELFLAPATSVSVAMPAAEPMDHMVFIPPPIYFSPRPNPPAHGWKGASEADLRRVLKVPDEFDGSGVTVGMIDTGFYRHAYYAQRSYDLQPFATPSAPSPQVDSYGHGTAMAFNIFALAPKARVLGFQQTDPPQDAFEDADDNGCDVISCSWGWDREQIFPVLQATILDVIRNGRIVLFAAGNGHYAWPASEPAVIAVGGVYWDGTDLEASNYASGFLSSAFPGRRVPDICGLCGQLPKAIYLMLPTQPGCTMDKENGGRSFPDRDETKRTDGWVGASGTSAACPQVAGLAALMAQKSRGKGVGLTSDAVREILHQTAVSIQKGNNAMGIPATGRPNIATGYGLVDATAALARI